jgi:hypothetical protein
MLWTSNRNTPPRSSTYKEIVRYNYKTAPIVDGLGIWFRFLRLPQALIAPHLRGRETIPVSASATPTAARAAVRPTSLCVPLGRLALALPAPYPPAHISDTIRPFHNLLSSHPGLTSPGPPCSRGASFGEVVIRESLEENAGARASRWQGPRGDWLHELVEGAVPILPHARRDVSRATRDEQWVKQQAVDAVNTTSPRREL